MDKNAWGSHMWTIIHAVALGYPEENPTADEKRNYRSFYEGLQHVLPCKSCRENFKKHLEKLPIDLSNQAALFKWTVDLHNTVNKMTGKKVTWSYDEARDYYLSYRGPAHRPGMMIWLAIAGVLIIALVVNVVMMFRGRDGKK